MTGPALLDVLALEQTGVDLFHAGFVRSDERILYGGQVLAQAVLAAGRTVPDGWLPHSLHGYFLRAGDSRLPTSYEVVRDRDGRSSATRRVLARQGGEVIVSTLMSLSAGLGAGPDRQALPVSTAPPPDALQVLPPHRVIGIETRAASVPVADDPTTYPVRFWVRAEEPLGDDPLLHLAVLTYWSDSYSGLSDLAADDERIGPSLDHSVWFHRPVRMDDWVWTEMPPSTGAHGRGFYTGTVWQDGVQIASLAQEALFRHPV